MNDYTNDECSRIPGIKEIYITDTVNIDSFPRAIRTDGNWKLNGDIVMADNRYYKINVPDGGAEFTDTPKQMGAHGTYYEQSLRMNLEDILESTTSLISDFKNRKLSVIFKDKNGSFRVMGTPSNPAFLTVDMSTSTINGKVMRSVSLGKRSDEMVYHYDGTDAIFSPPAPPLLVDDYPNPKFACFTKTVKSTYANGKAFIMKRTSDWAEQVLYFNDGVLDKTAAATFFGVSLGYVVAGYDQNTGTICKSCSSYGASSILTAPQIWDGSDFTKNEDGEDALLITGNDEWDDHVFVSTEFWSNFFVTSRHETASLFFTQDTSRYMFRKLNTGSFGINGGLSNNPTDMSINDTTITPSTSAGVNSAIPEDVPAVVSAMNFKLGPSWVRFRMGGPASNGYKYNGYWSGEIRYVGDKTSDKTGIVDILKMVYGIS